MYSFLYYSTVSTDIRAFLTICCVLHVISKCADNKKMSQQLQHVFHSARHRGGSRNGCGGGSCAWQSTHIPWASRIQSYHRGAFPTHLMAWSILLLYLTIHNPETIHSKQYNPNWSRQSLDQLKLSEKFRLFNVTKNKTNKWMSYMNHIHYTYLGRNLVDWLHKFCIKNFFDLLNTNPLNSQVIRKTTQQTGI